MAQIGLIIAALMLLWEGSKGFRSDGIKLGIFKADSEPITGSKGKLIGAFVIFVALVCLFFALVYIPLKMGM